MDIHVCFSQFSSSLLQQSPSPCASFGKGGAHFKTKTKQNKKNEYEIGQTYLSRFILEPHLKAFAKSDKRHHPKLLPKPVSEKSEVKTSIKKSLQRRSLLCFLM